MLLRGSGAQVPGPPTSQTDALHQKDQATSTQQAGAGPRRKMEERCRVTPVGTSREKPDSRKLSPSWSCQPGGSRPQCVLHTQTLTSLQALTKVHRGTNAQGSSVVPGSARRGRGSSWRELADGRGRGAPSEEAVVARPALPPRIVQGGGPLLSSVLHRGG